MTAERVRRGHHTLSGFARQSGLSRATLDSIENARKDRYSPTTVAALEYALGWQAGSVDRILRGLRPVPDEDADLTALIDAWPRLSPGARRVLRLLAVEAARAE